MEILTQRELQQNNRRRVFLLVYTEKKISKLQIAERLHLSLPTISNNLTNLINDGLVEKNGFFQSTGGRKSDAYSCISNSHIAIGIHITRKRYKIVAIDLYGDIIKTESITHEYSHCKSYYRKLGSDIESFIDSINLSRHRILGVGIALTALLSRDRQSITKSVLLGTAEATITDFKEFIPYPIQLFHDSEAAANAELWFSPNISDALYLGLSTHLNGMLIMNGRVHSGKEYTGGLVEHMILHPDGKPCYCGKKGCLTEYCSGHVLYGDDEINCSTFFNNLRTGSKNEINLWNSFLNNLAIGIDSIYALLDCDIVIGGTLGPYLIEDDVIKLTQLVRKNSLYAPTTDFIKLGHNNVNICAVGAAISFTKEFLESM